MVIDLKTADILLVLSPSISSQELTELAEEPQQYYEFADPDGNAISIPLVVFRKDLLAREPGEEGSLLRELSGKERRSMPLLEPSRMTSHQTTERRHKLDDGSRRSLTLDKEADWKLCDFGRG